MRHSVVGSERLRDTVSLRRLLRVGHTLGYPLRLLILLVRVYLGGRVLRAGVCCSEETVVYNSIVAGCSFATTMAVLITYDLLDRAHRFHPGATIKAYIDEFDDMAQRAQAATDRELIPATKEFFDEILKAGFMVSNKPVLVASSEKLSMSLQRQLRRLGINVSFTPSVRDLGLDASGGARRSVKLQKKRVALAKIRVHRVGRLVKLHKRASNMFRTGALPPRNGSISGPGPVTWVHCCCYDRGSCLGKMLHDCYCRGTW